MQIATDILRHSSIVDSCCKLLGLDKANSYAIVLRAWSLLRAPVTIYFIAKYLSLEEQGLWYTFQSLGALTIFAELGFTAIITQYVSHEFAHLTEKSNGEFDGVCVYKDRFVSLIRFSFKLYSILVVSAAILLTALGTLFISRLALQASFLFAWILYSLSGGFALLVTLFGAIQMGCRKVAFVQKVSLIGMVGGNILLWVTLSFGWKLWALAIGSLTNIVLSTVFYVALKKSFWHQILNYKPELEINWFREMLPYQWRYTISALSGYFIFQALIPITAYFAGTAVGGKLGMTLALTGAVQGIALIWGSNKLPEFNALASQMEVSKMEILLNTIQRQSLLILLIVGTFAYVCCFFLFPVMRWSNRILSMTEVLILLLYIPPTIIINNWAIFLRSFKKEPYMILSLTCAILTAGSACICMGVFKSAFIMVLCYTCIGWIMVVPCWRVFTNWRNIYSHKDYATNR